MRMAGYLSGLPRFSVNVVSDYDAVQASGDKIEFGERRELVVERPNRLRVDTVRSDGRRTTGLFTGSEIVLVDHAKKVYASAAQPDGLDDSLRFFVGEMGMRLPLALLLTSNLQQQFGHRVRSIDYVEKTSLFGVPAHHLIARGDTVDFQVWVRDGEQPLPLRVVLTYKKEPGQPQFRAQLVDWNLNPALTEATFRPEIPAGAQKIPFVSQLATVRAGGQGGKQ
ncbi:DUF2092 domain-containing protein [Massilia horti]|uniref:DUF2092 domain-containing protein n=2 Tax=Massilia horti TaxID=2562153 RepID=A0A4Y9SKV3_9BURK|nr:DUF2092 domain-containing protein [Massilia horti]